MEENLQEGMEFSRIQAEADRHFTSPPKAFTEDTLLMAMETAGNKEFDAETEKKGLGTPATRAAVIEKLVSSGYALRKGKQILPTVDGKALTAVIPTYLKSAAMTAEWENRLLLIERGQLDGKEFLEKLSWRDVKKYRRKNCSDSIRGNRLASARFAAARYMRENRIFTVPAGSVPLPCGKKTIIFPV